MGLSKAYEEIDSEVSKFLKLIFGLLLLPPKEASECFAFDWMSTVRKDKEIELFCDYLVENNIADDVTFPPQMLSEFSTLPVRTTNAWE